MYRAENRTDRNQALDFTKGVLVLLMVLYHWINYFVGIGGVFFTYLRFLPPSFIFIAGFMIANVYPAKYGFSGSVLYVRLIMRGFKLLVLFTLLNLMANLFFERSYRSVMPGVEGFIRDSAAIYISGNARPPFGILLPISYLLLLTAGIFYVGHLYKHAIRVVCAALFFLVASMEFHGFSSPNLALVGIGLLGVAAGFYPIEKIDARIDFPSAVVLLNLGYILTISNWGVDYLLLVIGVLLSVVLIYLIGLKNMAWGSVRNQIILLGKYSLFGYIAQIALLQFLHRSLFQLDLDHWQLLATSFVGAFALTIITVRIAHEIRAKSCTMDWLYRITFS